MKKLLLALAVLALPLVAQAQLYPLFGPVNGIMKGSAATPQTSTAVAADVYGLWSGTCSSTTFLRGDGSCVTPAGTVTGANPTATVGPTATNGSAITFMRSDGAPAINLTSAYTWTGLHTFNAGIASSTFTAHGVLLGEGASAVSPLVLGADTVLRGTASADPVATSVPNCGSSTTALNYNTTTHAFGCQTITSGGTGTVTSVGSGAGLTGGPITGSGSLAIDFTAVNTWSGAQTFSSVATLNGGTLGSASTTSALSYSLTNTGAGASTASSLILSNGSNGLNLGTLGTSGTANGVCSGSPSATHAFVCSTQNILSVGAGAAEKMRITNSGIAFHGSTLEYIAFGSFTNNGTTCVLNGAADQFGITSCARNSAGNVTITFSNTTGAAYGCIINPINANGLTSVGSSTATTATILTNSVATTPTDMNFSVVCF